MDFPNTSCKIIFENILVKSNICAIILEVDLLHYWARNDWKSGFMKIIFIGFNSRISNSYYTTPTRFHIHESTEKWSRAERSGNFGHLKLAPTLDIFRKLLWNNVTLNSEDTANQSYTILFTFEKQLISSMRIVLLTRYVSSKFRCMTSRSPIFCYVSYLLVRLFSVVIAH